MYRLMQKEGLSLGKVFGSGEKGGGGEKGVAENGEEGEEANGEEKSAVAAKGKKGRGRPAKKRKLDKDEDGGDVGGKEGDGEGEIVDFAGGVKEEVGEVQEEF